MNTQENNKIIAEFMGISIDGEFAYIEDEGSPLEEVMPINKLNYHKEWNWLMPVVEKIESDERYDVDILQYGTRISDNQKEIVNNIANISFDKKIDHTYKAVVEFINQYNKTK